MAVPVAADYVIDLSTAGAQDEYLGAIFMQGARNVSSGTGTFDPFVTTKSKKPVERNYNTDFTPIQDGYDTFAGGDRTHSIQLMEVPIVEYDGEWYYKFDGDINQKNADPGNLLSIDELRVFTADSGNLHG